MERKHPTKEQILDRTCPICQKVSKGKKMLKRHLKKHQKTIVLMALNGCYCRGCRDAYGSIEVVEGTQKPAVTVHKPCVTKETLLKNFNAQEAELAKQAEKNATEGQQADMDTTKGT